MHMEISQKKVCFHTLQQPPKCVGKKGTLKCLQFMTGRHFIGMCQFTVQIIANGVLKLSLGHRIISYYYVI